MVKKHKVQVIVHCKEYAKRQQAFESIGYIKYKLPMIHAYVIEVDEAQLENLKSMEGLYSVEVDTHITAQMNRVGEIIESRWANEHGYHGKGVGVAIVDTGIALHKDFVEGGNRVIGFSDFINHKTDPYDDNGHGTHVAYRNNQKFHNIKSHGLKIPSYLDRLTVLRFFSDIDAGYEGMNQFKRIVFKM
jgi:serine protease AprX